MRASFRMPGGQLRRPWRVPGPGTGGRWPRPAVPARPLPPSRASRRRQAGPGRCERAGNHLQARYHRGRGHDLSARRRCYRPRGAPGEARAWPWVLRRAGRRLQAGPCCRGSWRPPERPVRRGRGHDLSGGGGLCPIRTPERPGRRTPKRRKGIAKGYSLLTGRTGPFICVL